MHGEHSIKLVLRDLAMEKKDVLFLFFPWMPFLVEKLYKDTYYKI